MPLQCSGNPLGSNPCAAKEKTTHIALIFFIFQIMSQRMANGSSRNRNKVFDSLLREDVSEVDPSYKIFLENLSQDGNSYFFDVPDGDHGMPVSVRYEEDDVPCVVAMEKNRTNVPKNSPRRNRGGQNAKRPGAHINVKERNTSIDGSSRNRKKVFGSPLSDDASEVDPSYKIFLEHLSQDGNSYFFDVPDGDHGMPASVRYEEDDISSVGAMEKNCTNLRNTSPRRNRGAPNTKPRGAHINAKEMDTSIDESYAAFLSLMRIEDGFMVVEPEPGITVVYEQEDETPAGYDEMRTVSSTKDRKHSMNAPENMTEDRLGKNNNTISECGIIGPAPEFLHTESSAFNGCEDDQGEFLAFSSGVPSTFDEKLDSVLSQPYDQNEYEELLRKATDRKPVCRQKHLRGASKSYPTGLLGLSYLHHYPDLAKQIRSVDTDERRLNLLRKFFFWLENLSHEGAYVPWISKGLACDPIVADD